MATVTKVFSSPASAPALRPFDVRRDLRRVADLVEVCFADTLDADGQRYLQQMRAAAENPMYLRWASWTSELSSLPLSGYVWEAGERLLGNVSLVPYSLHGQRQFLIANVAVHPDFRRQGIGRQLTAHAMQQALLRGASTVWLHVRENNTGAIELYRSLGFVERARRTTWVCSSEPPLWSGAEMGPRAVRIGLRKSWHWPAQRLWLNKLYPPQLSWHMPLELYALQPGWMGNIYRFLTNTSVAQWSAWRDQTLLGVVAWQENSHGGNHLWLATPERMEDEVIHSLLIHARRRVYSGRPLLLDYPAHQAVATITGAGFHEHQTLLWMQAGLKG